MVFNLWLIYWLSGWFMQILIFELATQWTCRLSFFVLIDRQILSLKLKHILRPLITVDCIFLLHFDSCSISYIRDLHLPFYFQSLIFDLALDWYRSTSEVYFFLKRLDLVNLFVVQKFNRILRKHCPLTPERNLITSKISSCILILIYVLLGCGKFNIINPLIHSRDAWGLKVLWFLFLTW